MPANTPSPVLPYPPKEYSAEHMAKLNRAIEVFMEQTRNPGAGVLSALTLMSLPEYADNAAAVAGGMRVNDIYKTSAGAVRIVV